MKNCLVDIDKLIVNDQAIRYDFLYEMYPIINELYNKLWFYENLASLRPEIKEMRIQQVKNEITRLLAIYNVPESVLFVNIQDNRYLEPISRQEFRLNKIVETELVSDEVKETYIELYRKSPFFKHDMPKFKQLTKTKYKKS